MATAISLDFIWPLAHLLRVGRLLNFMSRKQKLKILRVSQAHMFDHDSIPARKWASNLPVSHTAGHSVLAVDNEATNDVADIYNQAGDDYVSYADGDASRPFAFDGMHAYADRCVWAVLEKKLTDLRAFPVRLLDAGCGPGTWLRRLVMRAHALGFSGITARGFDIAQVKYNGRGWRPELFPAFLE
jgi:hypothetical protein